MKEVDIANFRFDFDLTLAFVFMNADGTIYRRYGGRDHTDAMSHISMDSLVRTMQETLEDHAAYQKAPAPPTLKPKKTIMDIPTWVARPKQPDCIHCHMINEAEREQAKHEKKWSREDIWLYPLPRRVGMTVGTSDQTVITAIAKRSSADKAKLKKGDRLIRLNGVRVRTLLDIQTVLHETEKSLAVEYERGGKAAQTTLSLKKGWRVTSPLALSWRVSMWDLSPAPGFGGPKLNQDELRKLNLKPDTFAFRVRYLVTWGKDRHRGQNAQKTDIRKGDVVLSVAGKSDFETVAHFHAWFRLTRKVGETVKIEILRGGKRQTKRLKVVR